MNENHFINLKNLNVMKKFTKSTSNLTAITVLLLSLFLFPCIINGVFAQAPSIQWQKCLGGTNDDRANSIQQTSDGGFIVAGYTKSNDGDVLGNHGGHDFWVVKLDGLGAIQWQKYLGGTSDDEAYSIQHTSDGGFIVAGFTDSNNGNVSGNHGDRDCWVVKLNSSGILQWQKCLGGTDYDEAYSIEQTSDGGFIVVGRTSSNDGDVSGNHGSSDYWIVKLNNSGTLQWQKCLGGTGADRANSIQQTSDGGFIVAGYTYSNDGDVSGHHGTNYPDYWVVKLDGLGAILWQKCLGGTSNDGATFIKQISDGGFIVAGFTYSNDGDVSGNHGGFDYWVVKLDNSGNIEWQKCLGGTSDDYAESIQQTSDGGFIVVGYTSSNNGNVSGNHGGWEYWVVKLNSSGTIQWQKCLGGTSDDEAYSIQQTSDGGFIVAGYTSSNDGDVSGNHGSSDYWVVKLSGTDGINELDYYNLLSIYPNPFTENARITFDNPKSEAYRLIIRDITGKTVREISEIHGNTIEIHRNDLSTGVYMVELRGSKSFSGKLVVE